MADSAMDGTKDVAWYRLGPAQVAEKLGVDPAKGLSAAEAQSRLSSYGPNQMAAAEKEPGWKAFLRQYQDLMQMVLLGAGIVNQLVTQDLGTTLVLIGLTVVNAVMGLHQEAKAEASLAALQGMMKTIARVRRDGQPLELDASQIVPGDIVLMEAGNLVPADGRLFVAATVEIEEGALTGESVPVSKDIATIDKEEVPLGDRACMAYMNTSVTRGRGEMIVTGTGMSTEIGHIGAMLNATETDKTPLQKKLDELTKVITAIAALALVVIVAVGVARDQSLDELFITGIALAVAAIPTGLPAVVTTLLSFGTRALAERNAIMKRLPAVETLGSTSAICSDKTGTLTLNKMTARELVVPGQGNRFKITGEGYSTQGQITRPGGANQDLDPYLLPMALCADATLDGEQLIGDPTEGALIVLGGQGRARSRRDQTNLPTHRRGSVRRRLQVHGDVPQHDRCRRQTRRPLLCQGRAGRPDRPRRARSGTSTASRSPSPMRINTSLWKRTNALPPPVSASWSWPIAISTPRPSIPMAT